MSQRTSGSLTRAKTNVFYTKMQQSALQEVLTFICMERTARNWVLFRPVISVFSSRGRTASFRTIWGYIKRPCLKKQMAGDVSQWKSTWLACTRPCGSGSTGEKRVDGTSLVSDVTCWRRHVTHVTLPIYLSPSASTSPDGSADICHR